MICSIFTAIGEAVALVAALAVAYGWIVILAAF